MGKMVYIHDDIEDLNSAAAANIASILMRSFRLRGKANFALSGGSTSTGVYKALTLNPYRNSVPWSSVHFFWGDERCVPAEDPESNYRQAYDCLLTAIPVDHAKIHRIKGELSPQEAVSDYTKLLSEYSQGDYRWPIFDIAVMGMGEDGHTASLFPGMFNPSEDVKPVIPVEAAYQNRPACRITLTPMVFNASRNVIFLVAGEAKAETLQTALSDQNDPKNIPVQRIQPVTGNIIWHVDLAAAKYLQEQKKRKGFINLEMKNRDEGN